MDTIILHGIWFAIGFFCGMVVMSALALSSAISRNDVAQPPMWTVEYGEPVKVTPTPPDNDAELAEARETARFYQSLYQNLADTVKRA